MTTVKTINETKYDNEIQTFIREITDYNFRPEATAMICHWEKKPCGIYRLLQRIRVFFQTPLYKASKTSGGEPLTNAQKDFLLGISSFCEGRLNYGCRKEYVGDFVNTKLW